MKGIISQAGVPDYITRRKGVNTSIFSPCFLTGRQCDQRSPQASATTFPSRQTVHSHGNQTSLSLSCYVRHSVTARWPSPTQHLYLAVFMVKLFNKYYYNFRLCFNVGSG